MSIRVMAIDTSKAILELYHSILTDEGYEVFVGTFNPIDLSEIERIMPDVLILDYIPGRSNVGWELLQKLKMNRATANIPIIICTNSVMEHPGKGTFFSDETSNRRF